MFTSAKVYGRGSAGKAGHRRTRRAEFRPPPSLLGHTPTICRFPQARHCRVAAAHRSCRQVCLSATAGRQARLSPTNNHRRGRSGQRRHPHRRGHAAAASPQGSPSSRPSWPPWWPWWLSSWSSAQSQPPPGMASDRPRVQGQGRPGTAHRRGHGVAVVLPPHTTATSAAHGNSAAFLSHLADVRCA
jgi:hypothetical protein